MDEHGGCRRGQQTVIDFLLRRSNSRIKEYLCRTYTSYSLPLITDLFSFPSRKISESRNSVLGTPPRLIFHLRLLVVTYCITKISRLRNSVRCSLRNSCPWPGVSGQRVNYGRVRTSFPALLSSALSTSDMLFSSIPSVPTSVRTFNQPVYCLFCKSRSHNYVGL